MSLLVFKNTSKFMREYQGNRISVAFEKAHSQSQVKCAFSKHTNQFYYVNIILMKVKSRKYLCSCIFRVLDIRTGKQTYVIFFFFYISLSST